MKLIKEIRSSKGELHFQRWSIFSTRFGSLFLHRILKEDKDPHCHDHPWSFLSIVLWGVWLELRDGQTSLRGPLSFSFMRASGTYHKILGVLKPTWSLVFTGPLRHDWGYLTERGWVQNAVYRDMKRRGMLEAIDPLDLLNEDPN